MVNNPNPFLEAEDDAEAVLKLHGIYSPPVPTALIALVFPGTTIDVGKFFDDETLGFSMPADNTWHILINGNLPLGAQRFTAFHELYHMLRSEVGFSRQTPQGLLMESRANVFAANILMPARWFRREWEESRSIEKMADKFLVSQQAIRIRFKNLNKYINS